MVSVVPSGPAILLQSPRMLLLCNKRQSVLFAVPVIVERDCITLLYALLLTKKEKKMYVNDLCLQHSNTIFVVVRVPTLYIKMGKYFVLCCYSPH